MKTDGSYVRKSAENEKIRAQEEFYKEAVAAAELNRCAKMKFIPLKRPRE